MRSAFRPAPPAALLAAALLLAGCISFAPRPPEVLLTLSPAASPAAGAEATSANAKTITVLVPVTPAAIATNRVAVATGATSLAYVKGGYWSEAPARLFARLIADTVTTRTGRVVLSNAQSFADPGARLSGELRNFTIDAARGEAVVTYDATLMRDGAKDFDKRRFEARAPLGGAVT
ncbi:MAG: ABC-type transport auxiliary lipoprotein family protein, partial [Sphingomonas sp.]|nr:ABC-type transport auxiliary lipoprotein family protein [Sphingomonas sp.]